MHVLTAKDVPSLYTCTMHERRDNVIHTMSYHIDSYDNDLYAFYMYVYMMQGTPKICECGDAQALTHTTVHTRSMSQGIKVEHHEP
jgi:hypothetical protein